MSLVEAAQAPCDALATGDPIVLVTMGLAFLLYRIAFHGLPLHMDTAYYVPNGAVAGPTWGVFSGWNAHFSGVSRLLPQLVHTAIYRAFGGLRYASAFRWLYALLTLGSAWATVRLASLLGLTSGLALCGALVAYLAIASETQYGVFFESAEVFQALLQPWGVVSCLVGVQTGSDAMVGLGLGLLWVDAVLVKLTGAATAGAVSLAVLLAHPASWPWVLVEGALATGAYAVLLTVPEGAVRERLKYLGRHERHVRRKYPSAVMLALVKAGFTARLMVRNPAIPFVALAGAVTLIPLRHILPRSAGLILAAYALSLLVAFFRQGHRVWYYVIPWFPLIALAVAAAVEWLIRSGSTGLALGLVGAAGLLSLAINLVPRIGRDVAGFSRWVFSVYNRAGGQFGEWMTRGNLAIHSAAPELRERIAGQPTLVIGAFNQASALIGAAYDTPIASVCELAEGTAGDLDPWLRRPGVALPTFVLDTEDVFERYADLLPWLRRYRETATISGLRLFERQEDELDAEEQEATP